MASSVLYRRVLLKLSGEALMGERAYGLDPATVDRIALDVATVCAMPVQICIVGKTRQSSTSFEFCIISIQLLFRPVELLALIFLELSP